MAELQFTCPHCGQNIACDDSWCGQQIECPSCKQPLTLPAKDAAEPHNPLVPKVPAGGPKLSLGTDQTRKPAVPNKSIPIRNLAPPREKKSHPYLQMLGFTVVLAVLGVGGYYGYQWYKQRTPATNASAKPAQPNADPANPDQPAAAEDAAAKPAKHKKSKPAPAPVVWTLDLDTAQIPDARANGTISGAKFTAETARVDKVGPSQVLRLTQGALMSPDREVLVYLSLKAGQTLAGQTLAITKDTKGTEVAQVIKRWKDGGAPQPQLKAFTTGYAMKLELGQLANGKIPGKIFLAFPDPEQTVVAGTFEVAVASP